MITPTQGKVSPFNFGAAISGLFNTGGGKNFAFRLILWTAVFMALAFMVMGSAYFKMMGILLEGSWVANQDPENLEGMLEVYSGMMGYLPIVLLGSLLLWAVYASAETALHKRAMLGIDHGLIPLRFGKAELRTMLVQLVVTLLIIGFFIVAFLALFVIAAIFGGLAGLAGNGALGGVFAVIMMIVFVIGYIAILVLWVIITIQLAPASALTVATDKLQFVTGRKIAKKRTASLFLAYLFVYIVGYVVVAIIQLSIVTFLVSDNAMMLMMGMSEENPAEVFANLKSSLQSPGIIAFLVIGGIVYLLAVVTWYLSLASIGNHAVKWWQDDDMPGVFD